MAAGAAGVALTTGVLPAGGASAGPGSGKFKRGGVGALLGGILTIGGDVGRSAAGGAAGGGFTAGGLGGGARGGGVEFGLAGGGVEFVAGAGGVVGAGGGVEGSGFEFVGGFEAGGSVWFEEFAGGELSVARRTRIAGPAP